MNPERERIVLEIRAVVEPYEEAVRDGVEAGAEYRLRAQPLLDRLEVAARPFPDLQDKLVAARAELSQPGRSKPSGRRGAVRSAR